MSFRGRDTLDGGNPNKINLGEPRRFGGPDMDDKQLDAPDDRRFDSGRRGRPFGRGRRFSPPGRQRDFGYGRDDPPTNRDRSPMRGGEDRFSDRFKKDEGSFSRRDDNRRDMGRSFYDDDSRRMDWKSRGSSYDGAGNQFKSRGMASSSQKGFFNEGFPKPNECEIIAVNKQQRAYAESVEGRIKSMGILVDVLFLKDEALLTQTIDDIARRGSLYAMVINPQNETHGSVTVNLLHGTPQEHRNMPLEDALKLISRNFHDYIRTQRERMELERAERGPYEGCVAADREIQLLLRMLAEGRWISLPELDAVIRYLNNRRDKLQQGGPGEEKSLRRPPPAADAKTKDPVDVSQKEQDLQNRIMNIMNQGASALPGAVDTPLKSQTSLGIAGLKPSVSPLDSAFSNQAGLGSGRGESSDFSSTGTGESSATFLNFNNPSVQKALDNLISSGPNLLKNISNMPGQSPTPEEPMGMQRGGLGRGPSDMQGGPEPRGMDISPPRGGMGRGGSNMMGGMARGGFGGGMSDMGGGGYGPAADSGNMGPPRGKDNNARMGGGPPQGMGNQFGAGNNNQFNKFPGPGGQQGNYTGSYNANMNRPNFGGNQNMGGPRRY